MANSFSTLGSSFLIFATPFDGKLVKKSLFTSLIALVFGALGLTQSGQAQVVNGRNVYRVDYGTGFFQEVNGQPYTWFERTSDNNRFTFKKRATDEWSVYLIDESRGISIQLDLFKKEVIIDYDKPSRRKLYTIVDAKAPATREVPGPDGYTRVAPEGGQMNAQYPVDIAYGANGRYVYRQGLKGVIVFNNENFGDPIPGVAKYGFYKASSNPEPATKEVPGPAGYTWVAQEGGRMDAQNPVDVAYGANGRYTYRQNLRGVIVFNNETFGDPIPGVGKNGYYKASSSVPPVAVAYRDGIGSQSFRITQDVPWVGDNWNDVISCMVVPAGFKVIAYWDANFQGRSIEITGNWCADGSGWNDQISSLRLVQAR